MLAQRQPPFEDRVTAHWPSVPAPKMIGTEGRSRNRGIDLCRSVGERRRPLEAGAEDVADEDARYRLRGSRVVKVGANTNLAFKINDKTAVRKSLQINGASYGRNKY